MVSVAQLDRASDFESAGRPFEPDRARHTPRRVHGIAMNPMRCVARYELDVVHGQTHEPYVVHG